MKTTASIKACIRPNGPLREAFMPGFCSTKHLEVFLLSPEWAASPWQSYPQHLNHRYPIYTWIERGSLREKCLAREYYAMTD